MLILTIIIPTIIYVGKNIIQQPTETAEIEKQEDTNEEKISAETVTVNAGDSYTVPKDGIYEIELHGGKSADIEINRETILGNKGGRVSGILKLNKGNVLFSNCYKGKFGSNSYRASGDGICVKVANEVICYASGGPGISLKDSSSGFIWCPCCDYIFVRYTNPTKLKCDEVRISGEPIRDEHYNDRNPCNLFVWGLVIWC